MLLTREAEVLGVNTKVGGLMVKTIYGLSGSNIAKHDLRMGS